MNPKTLLRLWLATLLGGSTMATIGCGDMVRQSIKDGAFKYIAGSVSGGFGADLVGDFLTGVFTGGFGGGRLND